MTEPARMPPVSTVNRIRRFVDVEAHEVAAMAWSFVFFFCVLCAYYILRPVRDRPSSNQSKKPCAFNETPMNMCWLTGYGSVPGGGSGL